MCKTQSPKYYFNDLIYFIFGNQSDADVKFIDWLENKLLTTPDKEWNFIISNLDRLSVKITNKKRLDLFYNELIERFNKKKSTHLLFIANFIFYENKNYFNKFCKFISERIIDISIYKTIDYEVALAFLTKKDPVTFYRNYDFTPKSLTSHRLKNSRVCVFLSFINDSKALSHRYLLSAMIKILSCRYSGIDIYITNEHFSLVNWEETKIKSEINAIEEIEILLKKENVENYNFIVNNPSHLYDSERGYSSFLEKADVSSYELAFFLSGSHFSPIAARYIHGKLPRIDIQCQSDIKVKKSSDLTIVREGVIEEHTYYMPLFSLMPKDSIIENKYRVRIKNEKLELKVLIAAKAGKVLQLLKKNQTFSNVLFNYIEQTNSSLNIVGTNESQFINAFQDKKHLIGNKLYIYQFIEDFPNFIASNDVYMIPPDMLGGGMSTRIAAKNNIVIVSLTKLGDAVKYTSKEMIIEIADLEGALESLRDPLSYKEITSKQNMFFEREEKDFVTNYHKHLENIEFLLKTNE